MHPLFLLDTAGEGFDLNVEFSIYDLYHHGRFQQGVSSSLQTANGLTRNNQWKICWVGNQPHSLCQQGVSWLLRCQKNNRQSTFEEQFSLFHPFNKNIVRYFLWYTDGKGSDLKGKFRIYDLCQVLYQQGVSSPLQNANWQTKERLGYWGWIDWHRINKTKGTWG